MKNHFSMVLLCGLLLAFALGVLTPIGLAKDKNSAKDSTQTDVKTIKPCEPGQVVQPDGSCHYPDVALTAEESKDLEINELKRQNLILQMQTVERDIEEKFHFGQQKLQIFQENQRMTGEFSKAHHVDPAKYKLDAARKALVPNAGGTGTVTQDSKK